MAFIKFHKDADFGINLLCYESYEKLGKLVEGFKSPSDEIEITLDKNGRQMINHLNISEGIGVEYETWYGMDAYKIVKFLYKYTCGHKDIIMYRERNWYNNYGGIPRSPRLDLCPSPY